MKLYFVRHAEAVEAGGWAGGDETRPLTKGGKAQAQQVSGTLAALKIEPDHLLTSPLARAAETAEILAAGLHLKVLPRSDERLRPGFDAEHLRAILAEYPNAKSLLLVGHEPDFSRTIGELTGGRVAVKKGALALVELAGQETLSGELVWLAPPKLLAA